MRLLQVYVVLLVGNVTLCYSQDKPDSGLYNITVTSIEECADGGTNEVRVQAKLSKSAEGKVCFKGWVHLPYGLTNEQQEVWEISSRRSSEGWKASFLKIKNKRACSDTTRLMPQWFDILKAAHLNDTSCPVPKGNYTFTCVDLSKIQFKRSPILAYGMYRVIVKYYQNKVNVGCAKYEAEVRPRVNATSE